MAGRVRKSRRSSTEAENSGPQRGGGDIDADTLAPRALARLAKLKPESLPAVRGAPRIGPCLRRVGNFIAVGLNYADHAAESGMPVPKEPVLFNKAPSCVVGPNDDVMIPKGSTKTDWEVELAIVIGTRASYVSEEQALSHVAGYCVCNDVSEREFQLERSGQWVKGKSAPTFGPLGPWLVTPDEIENVQALSMWLDVNGERMQTGSTATMVFGVKTLVSYISQFMISSPATSSPPARRPGSGRQEAAALLESRRYDVARDRWARTAIPARRRLEGRLS